MNRKRHDRRGLALGRGPFTQVIGSSPEDRLNVTTVRTLTCGDVLFCGYACDLDARLWIGADLAGLLNCATGKQIPQRQFHISILITSRGCGASAVWNDGQAYLAGVAIVSGTDPRNVVDRHIGIVSCWVPMIDWRYRRFRAGLMRRPLLSIAYGDASHSAEISRRCSSWNPVNDSMLSCRSRDDHR